MQDILNSLFQSISQNWETLALFIGLVTLVSNFITDKVFVVLLKLKPLNNTLKQLVTAIVSAVLLFIGYFFQLGMFAEIKIFWQYVVLWIGVLLVSFGFYDLSLVRQILILLKIKLPPEEVKRLEEERTL